MNNYQFEFPYYSDRKGYCGPYKDEYYTSVFYSIVMWAKNHGIKEMTVKARVASLCRFSPLFSICIASDKFGCFSIDGYTLDVVLRRAEDPTQTPSGDFWLDEYAFRFVEDCEEN